MITLDIASENGSWLRCLLAKYPLWKNRRQLCRSNRVVLQHFKKLRTFTTIVRNDKYILETTLLMSLSLKEFLE